MARSFRLNAGFVLRRRLMPRLLTNTGAHFHANPLASSCINLPAAVVHSREKTGRIIMYSGELAWSESSRKLIFASRCRNVGTDNEDNLPLKSEDGENDEHDRCDNHGRIRSRDASDSADTLCRRWRDPVRLSQ